MVFPHMGLDIQPRRLARPGQGAQGAGRTEDLVADAADIEDAGRVTHGIEQAAELGDHRPILRSAAMTRRLVAA